MRILLFVLYFSLGNLSFSQVPDIGSYRNRIYASADDEFIRSEFRRYTDSLRRTWPNEANDTIQTWMLVELSNNYKHTRPDSAIFFARKAITKAQRLNLPEAEVTAILFYILTEIATGNYSKALQLSLVAQQIAEEQNLEFHRLMSIGFLGWTYMESGQSEKSLPLIGESLSFFQQIESSTYIAIMASYMAVSYSEIGLVDSAIYYVNLANTSESEEPWTDKQVHYYSGLVHSNIGDREKALSYFKKSKVDLTSELHFEYQPTIALAKLFWKEEQMDSSLYYAEEALRIGKFTNFYAELIESYEFLANYFAESDQALALEYNQLASNYKDSLIYMERSMAIDEYVTIDQSRRQQELEQEVDESKNRLKMNTLMGSSFTLLVVAFLLFRSRKAKQKSKDEIQMAYNQLQSTQTQLIHSEKMASLGELTAGIAHEIQNPLNFVNNFSEVNSELVEELIGELSKGNTKEAEQIGKEIIENEEKITHHGKRAEQIVKSMLQHSRTSEGKKELTDINALCDEYMRLAYHGFRAKDQSFNADFQLELDPNLPQIEVIPQDIGRVLLNILNNAFQAVADVDKPVVKLLTTQLNNSITIAISDNGPGIPEEIKEKIFQPFFTTKPTGQGTGLGLSISYDIVTKGHGGTLEVESEEGSGAQFIMKLSLPS